MKTLSIVLTIASLYSALAHAQYSTETQEAQSLTQNNSVHSKYHYCLPQTLTCRTLVLLKNSSNQIVPSFYDVFLSSERAVGSTGYFVENQNGTFHAYLDEALDSQVSISRSYSQNQALTVTFDSNNLPTISNMYLKRLGTTRFVIATMTYTTTQATIVGTEYDEVDTNYAVSVSATYNRVQN